ncbi:MAG: hypothetical protein U0N03_08795 [Lachnospiraceae bacterium]
MENELAKNLRIADAKIQYDTQCKKVLSDKQILAHILKRIAYEFQNYSIEEIQNCIEGEPEISAVPVNPGETNTARIHGLNTEDAVNAEGVIYYDIRFYVQMQNKNECIRIFINLEAQNKFRPGYEIVTRGIFYCSRMISAQLGTEFHIPDYDRIKKVYSIWICMDVPNYIGNAISKYSIQKNDLIPGIPDKPAAYDKINIILITLNEKRSTDDIFLSMMNALLSSTKNYTEKKKELSEKYHLSMENHLEKELNFMCNLSDYVEQQGIEKGIAQGMEKGIAQGFQSMVLRKHALGQAPEKIAEDLLVDLDTVNQIIENENIKRP